MATKESYVLPSQQADTFQLEYIYLYISTAVFKIFGKTR